MRYIFFTLLAANVLYFGYGSMQSAPETPERTPVRYPAGTEALYLLSENQRGTDDTAKAEANRVINTAVRRDNIEGGGECLAVGPFPDLVSGQDVVEQLAALDVASELRAVDQETGDSDFRVLIPPASSLQEAFRKLRELKSRGIDSYVLTQGPNALGVSLGLYSSREAAERASAQRAREGYDTIIIENPRLAREFWIFGEDGNLMLDPALWESLVSKDRGLEQRLLACPGRPGAG